MDANPSRDPAPREERLPTPAATSMESRAREVEAAAPGVAPIVEAALDGRPDPSTAATIDDPMDVVADQRAAMVRALELRDDPSLDAVERSRWATVVERLAEARHEAKMLLAEQRRADPRMQTWMYAEFQAQMLARDDDADPADLEARGAPAAPGDHSGRGEPAAWQPAADGVGPETGAETTPSNGHLTDQLTSGPGLAGGTGGAGSENYPADTGARPTTPPLTPDGDMQPPDVGHR
jgi:hypothetical protein